MGISETTSATPATYIIPATAVHLLMVSSLL